MWQLHLGFVIFCAGLAFVLFLLAAVTVSAYLAAIAGVFTGGAVVAGVGVAGWIDVSIPSSRLICEKTTLSMRERRELKKTMNDIRVRKLINDEERANGLPLSTWSN